MVVDAGLQPEHDVAPRRLLDRVPHCVGEVVGVLDVGLGSLEGVGQPGQLRLPVQVEDHAGAVVGRGGDVAVQRDPDEQLGRGDRGGDVLDARHPPQPGHVPFEVVRQRVGELAVAVAGASLEQDDGEPGPLGDDGPHRVRDRSGAGDEVAVALDDDGRALDREAAHDAEIRETLVEECLRQQAREQEPRVRHHRDLALDARGFEATTAAVVPHRDVGPGLQGSGGACRVRRAEIEWQPDGVPDDGAMTLAAPPQPVDEEAARLQRAGIGGSDAVVRREELVVRMDDLAAADQHRVGGRGQRVEPGRLVRAQWLGRLAAVHARGMQPTHRRVRPDAATAAAQLEPGDAREEVIAEVVDVGRPPHRDNGPLHRHPGILVARGAGG